MGLLNSIGGLLKATPLGTLVDRTIDRVLPDKLSEAEREQLKREIANDAHQRDMQILEHAAKQDAEFNSRIKAMEGTAGDLKGIPVIGAIVLFLRGLQRPLWGFAALYMDFEWFAGNWNNLTDRQETALLVVNLLVLTFLFGERAMKNVVPLLVPIWTGKRNKDVG